MSGTSVPVDDLQTSLGSNPDIERFYDNVQLVVPGITLSMLKVFLWNTVEDFCIKSTWFRRVVPWTMPVGASEVAFEPLSADENVVATLKQTGLTHYRIQQPYKLYDLDPPLTARSGQALLATRPTSFDAIESGTLFSLWFETILAGTLARLYGQPFKPWSQPDMAKALMDAYTDGVGRAGATAAESVYLADTSGLERIYEIVQLTLPDADMPAIRTAYWGMLEEFFIRSTLWRERLPWSMAIGTSEFVVTPTYPGMLTSWIIRQEGLHKWRVAPPATLVDLFDPTTARTGWVTIACKPSSQSVALPAELYSTWYETFVDGTLFRLFALPGRPWNDPKQAAYHGGRFRIGIQRARDEAERNWSNQQPRWGYPLFARGRQKQ